MMPDHHIHYQLGFARKPAVRITTGGATGGYAIRAAFAEVASGLHDVVMVGGMENYGTTQEDMARVVVKNKGNAKNNPDAQSPMDVTVEDVMKSPTVIYPLKILDHCLNSEGAATVILASEEAAGRFTREPVWITGIGASLESGRQAERDD